MELHHEEVDVGELVSGVLTRLAVSVRGPRPTGRRADRPDGRGRSPPPGPSGRAPPGHGRRVDPPGEGRGGVGVPDRRGDDREGGDRHGDPCRAARADREPRGAGNGGAGPWTRLALASKTSSCTGASCRRGATPTGTRAWFRCRASALRSRCSSRSAWASLPRRDRCTHDRRRAPARGCGGGCVAPAAAGRVRGGPTELDRLAAAALAATAATTLAVTGIVPQLLEPNEPAATSGTEGSAPKKADRKERREPREPNDRPSFWFHGRRHRRDKSSGTTGGTEGNRAAAPEAERVTVAVSRRRRARPTASVPPTTAPASRATRRVTTRVTTRTRTGIRARAPGDGPPPMIR